MPLNHKSCVLCGKKRCKCTYEDDQAGRLSYIRETTSAQATAGEMRFALESLLSDLDDDTPATWKISITPLNQET